MQFFYVQFAEKLEEQYYRGNMKQDIDQVVAPCVFQAAHVVVDDHGIGKERAVVRVFHRIKQTTLKGSDDVVQVFIVCLEVANENDVIELGIVKEQSRDIDNQRGNHQPQYRTPYGEN